MSLLSPVNIRFSGLYQPQIFQDLIVWKRINVPELTDEDPHEPFIQLLSALALVGHNLSCNLDHVALEKMLRTSRLRDTVKGHLELIGVAVQEATPAIAGIIITMPTYLTAPATLPAYMVFATLKTDALPEIPFETQAEIALSRTDQIAKAWELDGAVWTDRTAALNAVGAPFTPWGGAAVKNDMLYIGHDSVLWDQLTLAVGAWNGMSNPFSHYQSWEYYDGRLDNVTPTDVDDPGGGQIRFVVNTLLGITDRHGATVRVRCVATGAYEDRESTYNAGLGGNLIQTVGLLGQAAPPSLVPTDYVIGSLWRELPDIAVVTNGLSQAISFSLPETVLRRWQKVEVNDFSAYWIRCRVVNNVMPFTPDNFRIHDGKQYISTTGSQGHRQVDTAIGTSNGLADQSFVGGRTNAIQGTVRAFVDEGGGYSEWAAVTDLLSSTSVSNDFVVTFDNDGKPIVTFGDGVNGRIPPLNAVVKLEYRYGADANGNVGAETITVNKSGSAYVHLVRNPRAAAGWQAAEGSTADDLARLKIAGPASLRALNRALTADDCETLALSFVADDGTSPIARAWGREEGLGPKTVELICVGAGGAAIPSESLTDLDTHFNGDPILGTSGVLVLNSQVTSVNYTQKVINLVAVVDGADKAAINLVNIENALRALLSPLALEEDEVTWVHRFNGTVYVTRCVAEVFKADVNVDNVVSLTLNGGGDVALAGNELPLLGTISVTKA